MEGGGRSLMLKLALRWPAPIACWMTPPGARSHGCHTVIRAGALGASPNTTIPCALVRAVQALSVMTMKALIWSWILQPSATTPALSKCTVRDWSLANSFSSNRFDDEKEETWCLVG